ncbi:MAG: vacuolar membrane-associated protein iml1 [Icmadophila ericetorum]|nr:vacuolar membrane-associated protein iml1 [Icmadophila ericetorum]
MLDQTRESPVNINCHLGVHDESFSKEDALLNNSLFPPKTVVAGDRIRIVAIEANGTPNNGSRYEYDNGGTTYERRASVGNRKKPTEISYVFTVKDMPPELNSKHPNLEVSISQQIAGTLRLKNRIPVILTKVDEDAHSASHVEISFRDAYLTRADMWRLVISELAGKSMYKGQRILFMGTIKAQVKTIYVQGQKVQSAFFGSQTKPVFRSESARYVLFIQMSKEMWDFDTDGTGEIMFHKVINGFLPELFRRWEQIGARHLVSVILFTRLEYDQEQHLQSLHRVSDFAKLGTEATASTYRDFYRVVTSDMASTQWSDILSKLKKEFKTFLRDVSLRSKVPSAQSILDLENSFVPNDQAIDVIAGRPTAALRGNILEAINMASSQFSEDYIDRDLVRTGLSIVVISPGTGVFEVDHKMLITTTKTLIENGIGIDLVCLSRMPLHSVPLFKYRPPKLSEKNVAGSASTLLDVNDTGGSFSKWSKGIPSSNLSVSADSVRLHDLYRQKFRDEWRYAIPHWVDISFWTAPSKTIQAIGKEDRTSKSIIPPSSHVFVPRVRMYELQMMGIMEDETSNIAIPHMPRIPNSERDEDVPSSTLETSIAHLSTSRSSDVAVNFKRHGSLLGWMEDHDDALFRHPLHRGVVERSSNVLRSSTRRTKTHQKTKHDTNSASLLPPTSMTTKPITETHGGKQHRQRSQQGRQGAANRKSSVSSIVSTDQHPPQRKPSNLSRQISFGLRGFGVGAPKAVPVTEISIETALPSLSLLSRGLRSQTSSLRDKSTASPILTETHPSVDESGSEMSNHESEDTASLSEEIRSTKPIAIRVSGSTALSPDSSRTIGKRTERPLEEILNSNIESKQLSPNSAMAPWLTVLNPSNPHKLHADLSSRLGRWHHVFPRALRASSIKWKSLCSPASVPLTTEAFPSADQLSSEYEESKYQISTNGEDDLAEDERPNKWLLRELISARLSHGFQMVVGLQITRAFGDPTMNDFNIFSEDAIAESGTVITMSRGNTIHQLRTVDAEAIEIKQFIRRLNAVTDAADQSDASIAYQPAVRTMLSQKYIPRNFIISSSRDSFDWQRLDNFIAGHEEQQFNQYPESLHFWRARFVLIPMEEHSSSKKPINEDNEEEIRLEGIRKLTQIWQKHRYIPPSERRFQSTSRMRKDPNPLDIIYQTRHPSAIVAAELDNTLLIGNDPNESKPSQLLPESDLLERDNLNLTTLAQTIQSERGVKLMDRRWHLRLHYNCFIGMELTTWLLNNFKDIDSREEAVQLGNELMKEGLFQHVEQRHNFRDGNFFYQIASDYRTPRSETRGGWFGSRRSDQSVPSTPMNESMRPMTSATELRSSLSANGNEKDESGIPTTKQKLGVTLSKRLIYEVDFRKKSYRNELINLHYDRISSADDCYHLRIDWMNVTPKLIEDSIVHWATTAQQFGLRLVELPIGEASKINEVHPFRAPHLVQLAIPPPPQQPQTYFDATSLAPKATQKFPYQKAILKKFNFVLDLEAVKAFPPSVDVTYSWGKPDYQFPQYISREGILIAQITDEGDILLLANRLYNSRSVSARDASKTHQAENTQAQNERGISTHRSPARSGISSYHPPPPTASPMTRAVCPDHDAFISPSSPNTSPAEAITSEKLKDALEAFCHDAVALEKFYDEVLSENEKASAASGTPTGGNTPFLNATMSGAGAGMVQLGLPPRLSLRGESPMASRREGGGIVGAGVGETERERDGSGGRFRRGSREQGSGSSRSPSRSGVGRE